MYIEVEHRAFRGFVNRTEKVYVVYAELEGEKVEMGIHVERRMALMQINGKLL